LVINMFYFLLTAHNAQWRKTKDPIALLHAKISWATVELNYFIWLLKLSLKICFFKLWWKCIGKQDQKHSMKMETKSKYWSFSKHLSSVWQKLGLDCSEWCLYCQNFYQRNLRLNLMKTLEAKMKLHMSCYKYRDFYHDGSLGII